MEKLRIPRRRTPPGVRELKLVFDCSAGGLRSGRTPPGVRELKLTLKLWREE